MRGYDKFKIICVTVIITLIAVLHIVNRADSYCPPELKAASPGIPIIKELDNNTLFSGIKQIVEGEKYLYVLYGKHGIIQVYDLFGNYQFSISVYSHKNGRIKLAYQDGKLFVRDKQNNLYAFTDNALSDYFDKTISGKYIELMDFQQSAPNYHLHMGSVYKITVASSQCIIQRPAWLALHENGMGTIAMMGLMAILGVILLYKKKF